jgi:CDP-glucose 4,6-dehydratase
MSPGRPQPGFWRGKKVLVTGHTGFKGGWLAVWLNAMQASVVGYALKPQAHPSFFDQCALETRLTSILGDIRHLDELRDTFAGCAPDIVFHLAAQPLVRQSYRSPVETFETNVMGTVGLLEVIRCTPSVRAAVIITTDKCYENREWVWGYREQDRLGGQDPYSASKACAELVAAAYRQSYFSDRARAVALATVRAGNVIGGGDWAEDRVVPDAIRALMQRKPVLLRNPGSVRPWQHVLEPLAGYLMLAERLYADGASGEGAWNFGPSGEDAVPVVKLVDLIISEWGAGTWEAGESAGPHEARTLRLDCSKSRQLLGWEPRLRLREAAALTAAWYRQASGLAPDADMYDFTVEQIRAYETVLEASRE